jgi:hypothetical protein
MPEALTQKAREEKEEQRVLKRLKEKRLKEQGVEVVVAAPKTPVVVADTSVKKHLYGWGGTRTALGSKGGSTDLIGNKKKSN